MSNCVVGSGGGGMPLGVVTEHGVEGYNHLAHHGDDDDFGLFAGGGEARHVLTKSTTSIRFENSLRDSSPKRFDPSGLAHGPIVTRLQRRFDLGRRQ